MLPCRAHVLVVLGGLLPAAMSVAAPPPVPPPAALRPIAPPTCEYLQRQVKKCSVSPEGGLGTFDVVIAPPASLVVTFEEPLVGMTPPPPSSYRATFSGSTATVIPIRRDPLAGSTVHFDTASLHVTLNLVLGPTPDTQVLVADPRRPTRDHEVERRLKEETNGLDERVAHLADEALLREIADSGIEVLELGAAPTRHNQVVVRAQKLFRVGARRILLLSLENRSGDTLELSAVRAWKGPEGSDRELARPVFHAGASEVKPDSQVSVAVALSPFTSTPADRLRLRVEFSDSEHNVEVAGMRLR